MSQPSTQLYNRNIILCICGGIAAYKMAETVRLLKNAGANVQIVMTTAAQQFVTPLSLQALSGQPVRSSLFDQEAEAAMSHIELARWADLVVIAPATANMIAKLANGICDDLITTLITATTAPVIFAPAMNSQMWLNAINQTNVKKLIEKQWQQLGPNTGDLACGEHGSGRMVEPSELKQAVVAYFTTIGPLNGVNLTITAGPTRESIDPVRYISNRSSGKMGFALAQAALNLGANVTLVAGPVNLPTPKGVKRINVETADQMLNECCNNPGELFIACAAVADYRVKEIAPEKIKKGADTLALQLIKNPDILQTIAENHPSIFTVGFAAETDKLKQHALEKLKTKKIHLIAANLVGEQLDSGFESDNNQLYLYWNEGGVLIPNAPKTTVAKELMTIVSQQFHLFKKTK